MFKKSLAAVAVLGAFAGSALAADVQLYGLVDLGLNWTQTDKSTGTEDTFGLKDGQNSPSRFGLKGTEDLGNGYTVGFLLENGFSADDGQLGNGSRLFGREALLFVQTPFGEIAAGRTGSLDAGTGRYNLMGSGASALGTGWDTVGASTVVLLGTGDRLDNALTYKSPNFAGFNVYAQVSLKRDNKATEDYNGKDKVAGQEGSSDADRYYAVAATYGAGALKAGLIYSQTDYSRYTVNTGDDDEGQAVSAYVNYDFGMVKPMLAVQYWDGGLAKTNATYYKNEGGQTKGYGVVASAVAPLVGGTFKASVGYNDYEPVSTDAATDYDGNNLMVGVGYEYPLSKRTSVYTAAGYNQIEKDKVAGGTDKKKTTEVMVGMIHKF